jgi:DNA-binding HxlR family transcriptional regulator
MGNASQMGYAVCMTVQLAGPLAKRGDSPLGDRCPIDRTLQLVGNRTALLLLREAFYGATRFDQLWKRVGVTEAVAAQRLRELVSAGVLEKQPYREPGQRTRSEYVLTAAGHDLMPVVLGLLQWGAAHAPKGGGAVVTHDGCGAEVRAVVRCAAGHDVDEADVVVAAGRS